MSLSRLSSVSRLRYLSAGLMESTKRLYRSAWLILKHRCQILLNRSKNSRTNPMSDELNSRGDLQDSTVDCVTSNGSNSPVASARATSSPDHSATHVVLGILSAICAVTSIVLWVKLRDAEKDIQTQIWLRDDALTKFEQGPFADLKAHELAMEITCRK